MARSTLPLSFVGSCVCSLLVLRFSTVNAEDLSLCDKDLFSLTMVNVDLNRFAIYRDRQEWDVFNLSQVSLNRNVTLPGPILTLIHKESGVLVARNWKNNKWLVLASTQTDEDNQTMIQFDCSEHISPLHYEGHINALFYSPLDDEFYAIAGTSIFAIHKGNSTFEFLPTGNRNFNMTHVKLVLFTTNNSMFLIEKYRYCNCTVSLKEHLKFKCSNWMEGDIICSKGQVGKQLSGINLFWLTFGLLALSICVLITLMLACVDRDPRVSASDCQAKVNQGTNSKRSAKGKEERKLSAAKKQPPHQSHAKPKVSAGAEGKGKQGSTSARSKNNAISKGTKTRTD